MLSAEGLDVNELANVDLSKLCLDNQTLMYFAGKGIENVYDLISCCNKGSDGSYDENMILQARFNITMTYGYGLVS